MELIEIQRKQTEAKMKEIERRIKMLHWFINGYGRHGITWDLYDSLTPDWVTKNYNVDL